MDFPNALGMFGMYGVFIILPINIISFQFAFGKKRTKNPNFVWIKANRRHQRSKNVRTSGAQHKTNAKLEEKKKSTEYEKSDKVCFPNSNADGMKEMYWLLCNNWQHLSHIWNLRQTFFFRRLKLRPLQCKYRRRTMNFFSILLRS